MRPPVSPSLLASLFAVAMLLPPAAHAGMGEAPPFNVRGVDGKPLRLSDYKGKPVIVDFWATWCGPCRASLPHLAEIQDRYRSKGLVVVGLSIDDGGPQIVRRYVEQVKVRFRMGMADEHVLDQYGPIRSIPTTFFINRRGDVIRRVVGYIDPETMDSYAAELF